MNEHELLNAFRQDRSEAAFGELVRHYAGLVYSVAKRRSTNAALAEDITQLVFIRFARTPPDVQTHTELAAWLHRTTVNVTIDTWRSESRRQRREQQAAAMQSTLPDDSFWEDLAPNLDEGLNQLNDEDRQALLLRFFDCKTMREVGAALGVSEDAAKMRVSRALERLRTHLSVQGAACTAAVLGALLTEHSVEAAPAQLLSRLASIRLTIPAGMAGKGGLLAALMRISRLRMVAGAALLVMAGVGLVQLAAPLHAPSSVMAMASPPPNLPGDAILIKHEKLPDIRQVSTSATPAPTEPMAHPPSARRYVEISAEVDMVSYVQLDTKGAPIETKRSFQFTCIVGTNEWRIETGFSPLIQETWFYDGTDVYESSRITNDEAFVQQKMPPKPGQAVSEMGLADPEIIKSNLTITVTPSPGGHPLGHLGINIPWLAYCSGSYLKQQARVIPLPTTVISGAKDAFAYVDKTVAFPDQLGLPYILDLLTSRDQYRRGLEDKRIYRNTNPALAAAHWVVPAYPDGTLKFHYEVQQATNFDGWKFPMQFSYVDYRPRKGVWYPYVAGLGKMLSIRECGPPESVFDTNLQQTVQDFRFRQLTKNLDAITYTTTNNALSPTNDPSLQSAFERAAAARSER